MLGTSLYQLIAALVLTALQPVPVPPVNPPAIPTPAPAAPGASTAEKIARAREVIESGRRAIERTQRRTADPNGEYATAEAAFQKLDKQLRAEQDQFKQLHAQNKIVEAAASAGKLKDLQEQWNLARQRFDAAIRQRKADQDALAAVKVRIQEEQKLLDQLEGRSAASPAPAVAAPQQPAMTPPASPLPGVPAAAAAPAPATPVPESDDPAVKQAREQLEARQAALKGAEDKAKSAAERVQALEQTIKAAEEVLAAERDVAEQAHQAIGTLTARLGTAPPAERAQLAGQANDASRRLAAAQKRVARITTRLGDLNAELHNLQKERIAALQEADSRKAEVAEADKELAHLVNPFTVRNMTRWLVRHGPNLAGILVGVAALYLLVRQCSRHIVRLMARHNHRGSEDDRENRANTLVGVFRYAASLLVLGAGVVMLLDEAGIPVIPLMGGAAVLGLAVAFGAQNLIKDYFSGFMILLEDQYGVNDVVRIDSISGQVERISLRVTALRDQEGTLHFVPHGSITTVSNMTHTWSRALLDVSVSYDADLDQVVAVLLELGHEMRRDPLFAAKITDDPEMLGVDALGDSAVTVRFLLRTRPLQQWAVKRELLKRIKRRFDELGISIPYPHRTVLHKFPDGLPPVEGRNGVSGKAGRGGPWPN